jgi:histidinol-phosphate phosphatase family protein
MTTAYAVVVPTIGRPSLDRLLAALDAASGPQPAAVVVVDDRPAPEQALTLPDTDLPVKVLRSGGRGPAAARNVGWRSIIADWVCFLDDDVVPGPDWYNELASDLRQADDSVVGSQGTITVPAPQEQGSPRRPTDDERRTLGLATAQWITADMAYRRSALVSCGGFDERFPRAYREDADIALRLTRAGGRIVQGARQTEHPVPVGRPSVLSSVRAQRGNRDDALMRRKHGRGWRPAIGEGRGRLPMHVLTTGAALTALTAAGTRRRRAGIVAALSWLALTVDFTLRRIAAGPGTAREVIAMALSSVLIPPVAVAQRLWGTLVFRAAPAEPPLAVLLDRDDTLIEDGPYLNDPAGVVPMPTAQRALGRLRKHGLLLAVVTNQSGVAKGLISPEQLDAVNLRVEELLGPFDCWQVCVHDGGCPCRKPAPGMVIAAADALGVDTRRCVMIGDTGGDVAAAQAAEAAAILVPTGRTLAGEISAAHADAQVAGSLDDAVSLVLKASR